MSRKQTYKTRKRACDRCKVECTDTEKVSARIMPPEGGYLCPECILPATLETTQGVKS